MSSLAIENHTMRRPLVYYLENILYLLWVSGKPRSEWAAILAIWAQCDLQRARILLQGGMFSAEEQANVAFAVGYDGKDLTSLRLIEVKGIDVLQENIKYLLGTLAYGQKQVIARRLDVYPSTISRWASGEQMPRNKYLQEITKYFDLPFGKDLRNDLVFLAVEPFSLVEQQNWLKDRIEKLDAATLRKLFPELVRLLDK